MLLTPLRSSSLVLVLISRMYVPVCNYFYARRANISKITDKGYPSLTLACAGFLEPRGSALGLLKFPFNAENFFCRLSCSVQAFRRNSPLKWVLQPKIAENSLKPSFLRVQGRLTSLMLINLKNLSLMLVMTSSISIPICDRFHTKRANSGKITSFLGVPFFAALVREEPRHPGWQNFVTKSRVFGTAHSEDFVILAYTVLIQCQGVADGRTNGQTNRRLDDG